MSAPRTLAERLVLIADLWDEMRAELRRGGTIYPGDIAREDTQALRDAAAELERLATDEETPRPRIVCLCGSTRFIEAFAVIAWELEKDGRIVLGLHYLPASYAPHADHQAEAEGVAGRMDELHLRKIDLADEVLVLNVGGYIGESTAREIAYAEAHGKPVRYVEPLARLAGGANG